MNNFKEFLISEEVLDAKNDLAIHLIKSKIDLKDFNKSLQIIQEWGYNPFATFGKSAAAGAGAVLGSAFGPAGTALGGMAGGALGSLGSSLAGKFMKGAKVDPVSGPYKQAIQAVDALSKMLGQQDVQANKNAAAIKQNVDNLQKNLQGLEPQITQIDQQRNQSLDTKLQAGGGIGASLRGADSSTKLGQLQNWIGEKIKGIPALNQDQGLRRAMAKGMDAIQDWASKNPKKAALINIGSGIAGGLAGAVGAAKLQQGFQGTQQQPQQQQQQQPQKQQPYEKKSWTSDDAKDYLGDSPQKGVPSGQGGGGIDEPLQQAAQARQSAMQNDPSFQRAQRVLGTGRATQAWNTRNPSHVIQGS